MQKGYKKKYNVSWELIPEYKGWLEQSKSDVNDAFCKVCRCTLRAHKTDLSRHKNTTKHKLNMSKIDCRQTKIHEHSRPILNDSKKIEAIRYATFIAQHSSIRSIDHLVEIINSLKEGQSTKTKDNLKLHRTKCSAIIKNVINPALLKMVLDDIGDSNYSLIVDESTDVGINKYMCICVKFFSKSQNVIKTHFLGLINVVSTTSEDLFIALKTFLENNKLSLQKLVGLGTDGANNLCGSRNSLYTKLKNVSPNVMLVKCICHSLHLCASNASKVFNNEADFIVRETYNWFKNSSLRRDKYHKIYDLLNNNDNKKPLNLIQISQTRWLSRFNAVDRICNQYLELETFFEISADKENCHTAWLLFNAFKNKRNHIILLFLRPILKQINSLNMYFQKDKIDFFQAYSEIKNFILVIVSKIVKEIEMDNNNFNVESLLQILSEENNFKDKNEIEFNDDFNNELNKLNSSHNININELKEDCQTFIIKLTTELIKRLPNHLEMFKGAFILSPEKCLSHLRIPFNQLPIHLISESKKNAAEIEYDLLLAISWKNIFKDSIPKDSEEFWKEAYKLQNASGDKMLENICELAFILLTLPHSNAFVERVFSVMNLTKTKIRNRMMLEMLSSIIRIKCFMTAEKYCCKSLPIGEEMLCRFNSSIYEMEKNNNQTQEEQESNCLETILDFDELNVI